MTLKNCPFIMQFISKTVHSLGPFTKQGFSYLSEVRASGPGACWIRGKKHLDHQIGNTRTWLPFAAYIGVL